jgi:hypothetical protein
MACFQNLVLGDCVALGKAKSTAIFGDNSWTPGELRVLWQPGNFDKSASETRVSINFEATDAVQADVARLEAWILATVATDPMRYLGQSISASPVQDRFVSALKCSQKGFKSVRCKMNTEGKYAVRCWDENKVQRGLPDDWTEVSVTPRIVAKSLWIQASSWGILLELTHAQVQTLKEECPF